MSIELRERRAGTANPPQMIDGPLAVTAPGEEARTQAIGRELFAAMDRQHGFGGLRERVYDGVMQWTMRDEALKTPLFRLMDVLPALRTPEQVARHVREHLLQPDLRLPAPARALLSASATNGAAARFVAWAARYGSMQMAHRFIAGADRDEALATAQRLRPACLPEALGLLRCGPHLANA